MTDKLCYCSTRMIAPHLAFATVRSRDLKTDIPVCSFECFQKWMREKTARLIENDKRERERNERDVRRAPFFDEDKDV